MRLHDFALSSEGINACAAGAVAGYSSHLLLYCLQQQALLIWRLASRLQDHSAGPHQLQKGLQPLYDKYAGKLNSRALALSSPVPTRPPNGARRIPLSSSYTRWYVLMVRGVRKSRLKAPVRCALVITVRCGRVHCYWSLRWGIQGPWLGASAVSSL